MCLFMMIRRFYDSPYASYILWHESVSTKLMRYRRGTVGNPAQRGRYNPSKTVADVEPDRPP